MDTFISLLYPTEEARRAHLEGSARPRISPQTCQELGLFSVLPLKSSRLTDYFTCDTHVIAYREEVFADMAAMPQLVELLADMYPVLQDVLELRRLNNERGGDAGASYLYSITEIELYVKCVQMLTEGLQPLAERLTSRALQRLYQVMQAYTQGEDFQELLARLRKLTDRVHEIKSVTVGVNVDAQYRPTEAGVISINAEPFKSGKLLDKILRLSFRNDAMTCIAPLTAANERESENRRDALTNAFHDAIEDVFRSSVKGWRAIVSDYVLDNADFMLRLLPEIELVTKGAVLARRLSERGLPLCRATLHPAEDKVFAAYGLYNPDVALRTEGKMVTNDLILDDNARLYILSGPNRGGKSVITCAMGLAQCLAQLGLGVPAERADLSPVNAIFTHFPEGADDTIDKGRLGEECARLREIFDDLVPESMVLLDESLSSTGAYEAAFIAAEILTGLAVQGCRGIFSTHLHELSASLSEINDRSRQRGGVAVDTLVAGIEEGERSFRIVRKAPDGKSYARDIAKKYGLSLDELVKSQPPLQGVNMKDTEGNHDE